MDKEKLQYLDSKEDTMPLTRRNRASREIERKLNNQGELIWRTTQAIQQDGVIQVLEGVFLARASSLLGLNHHLMTPSFCMIVQGSKEFLLIHFLISFLCIYIRFPYKINYSNNVII